MYTTTQQHHTNAATLPRSSTSATIATMVSFNANDFDLKPNENNILFQTEQHQLQYNNNTKSRQTNVFINSNINGISNIINSNSNNRPTYGAYTNNTLPRGPYLQYKFNDQHSSTQSKYMDNNRRDRQIEGLRKEFTGLPRVKIISNENAVCIPPLPNSGVIQTVGQHQNHHSNNENLNEYVGREGNNMLSNQTKYNTISNSRGIKVYQFENRIGNRNGIIVGKCFEKELEKSLSSSNLNFSHNNFTPTPSTKKNGNRMVQPIMTSSLMFSKSHSSLSACGGNLNCSNPQVMTSSLKSKNSESIKNIVTLADVLTAKRNGLNLNEGWALLCQSIQALQDLFLADTPSTARILPLVNPSSLQISARGRVLLSVVAVDKITSNSSLSSYHPDSRINKDVLMYLSPEYVNCIGKHITFSESDIEKMWIYSLGVTLRKTIPSSTSSWKTMKNDDGIVDDDIGGGVDAPDGDVIGRYTLRITPDKPNTNKSTYSNGIDDYPRRYFNGKTSLDLVISLMCEDNLKKRASLMYLLDVISDYCKTHHQNKPFSHIVMDLFKDVIAINKSDLYQHDEHKSDTDSGRSSCHEDKQQLQINYPKEAIIQKRLLAEGSKAVRNLQLKVDRFATLPNMRAKPSEHPIVLGGQIPSHPHEVIVPHVQPADNKKLQVVRRRDIILKKRNINRRNTIDLNKLDLKRAQKYVENNDFDGSKSANHLDKIKPFVMAAHQHLANCSSMPELDQLKCATLPSHLKVRRYNAIAQIQEIQKIKSKGPEFIMNAGQPVKQIDLTDTKCTAQMRRIVNIIHLTGQQLHIVCNSTMVTVKDVFESVVKRENISENFFLGLCVLIGGDFVFLPLDLKIYKVAPQIWITGHQKKGFMFPESIIFTLFMRIKFFLPNLRGISSLESRHLLYFQLRKSVLERQILCNEDDLITLGGLALQAEIGDFNENMKYIEYFTISHYLPEEVYQKNKEMARYLRNSHLCKKSLHPMEARHNFIRYAQELKEYGLHLYSATWTNDENKTVDVYIAISLAGLSIFERNSKNCQNLKIDPNKNSKTTFQRKVYENFDWLEIENLCFSKHILCVAVRKMMSLSAKDKSRQKYKFKMNDKKSYFAFHLASEHHKFYMKLRNSFVSLKSISDELNVQICSGSTPEHHNSQLNQSHSNEIQSNENQENNLKANESKSKSEPILNEDNLIKLDKMNAKAGKSREKNVSKKSMLNDGRLLKLKQKFLKRSKSSAEMKVVSKNIQDNEIDQQQQQRNTKEESQNKENECPRVVVEHSSPKSYKINRNKVKMGTRVFSTQFLNKSLDNIYDSPLDLYLFDGLDNSSSTQLNQISYNPDDDGVSMKSTSVGSIYFSDKTAPPSEKLTEANKPCVVHTSIRSMNYTANNYPLDNNETISDSLLDKFNNLSTTNSIGDRIIRKIYILKDQLPSTSFLDTVSTMTNIIPPLAADGETSSVGYQQSVDVKQRKCSTLKQSKSSESLFRSKFTWFSTLRTSPKNSKSKKVKAKVKDEDIIEPKLQSVEKTLTTTLESGTGNSINLNLSGYTLGISIIQGTDNNVYVKDLVKSGPGERAGVKIGDQIIAVNGISLINLSYADSLNVLQKTERNVELIVSQIFNTQPLTPCSATSATSSSNNHQQQFSYHHQTSNNNYNNSSSDKLEDSSCSKKNGQQTRADDYLRHIRFATEENFHSRNEQKYLMLTKSNVVDFKNEDAELKRQSANSNKRGFLYENELEQEQMSLIETSKSMPELPKVFSTFPKTKKNEKAVTSGGGIPPPKPPRNNLGVSRKFIGHKKFPVTPAGKESTIAANTTTCQKIQQPEDRNAIPNLENIRNHHKKYQDFYQYQEHHPHHIHDIHHQQHAPHLHQRQPSMLTSADDIIATSGGGYATIGDSGQLVIPSYPAKVRQVYI